MDFGNNKSIKIRRKFVGFVSLIERNQLIIDLLLLISSATKSEIEKKKNCLLEINNSIEAKIIELRKYCKT